LESIESFKALQLKIENLQNHVDVKQHDIEKLKEAFTLNVNYFNELVQQQQFILRNLKNQTSNLYSIESLVPYLVNYSSIINPKLKEEILSDKEKLKNILLELNLKNNVAVNFTTNEFKELLNTDIKLPKIVEFLPHLRGQEHNVQPKFKLTKSRYGPIVIGIPTIKREKTSYLVETLKSLFDSMNDLEKNEALVIVMIAEFEDSDYIQETIELLTKIYKDEVDSGLLEIIVPPAEFYPNLDSLGFDRVFNDSSERVKWRTKQNYDFSYLMTYAQNRGDFYLQLEDDVIAKSGFYTIIKNYIQDQKSREWMLIEFSRLGFIGKLFKCKDLPIFVNFFLMFATNKPCDWLFESVLNVKICNPEKGQDHCQRSVSKLKIVFKPSLFQHVGKVSSLKGKTQNLKDKDFGKYIHVKAQNNPPAQIVTSLKTYMKHTIESAYLGHNFFWSMAPKSNDYILFNFKKPATINKYYIKSGNSEHPDDKIKSGTFHIKTKYPIPDSMLPVNYFKTSDDYYAIDTFDKGSGVVSGNINRNITGGITNARIHIPISSETWILITEITFT
jgi:alpha-1,3-mannosylglycoprotein beta-1,4-N-acetylglucosaminyltransferase A/B